MMQNGRKKPAYASLLEAVRADLAPLVEEVARDVGPSQAGADEVADASRRALEATIGRLLEPPNDAAEHDRLRAEGRRSARDGEPLRRLLDRYLTAGWVIWEAATAGGEADAAAVASLGTALLRAGDAAAASLADGYGEAERELAARAASARREFVDELLELPLGGPSQERRVLERAAHFGMDPAGSYRVVVAWLGRELEDESPEVESLARAIARPRREGTGASGPTVATRRGRLVVLAHASGRGTEGLDGELGRLAGAAGWVAVASEPADGLSAVGPAFADAMASLDIAQRIGLRGRRLTVGELLLERALLAGGSLTAAAVDRELRPLLASPRRGEALVETVAAYLANGQGVRATARSLGIATRTVAYRLERAEALLGGRIAGDLALRLAAVVLARRLQASDDLNRPAAPPPGAPDGRSPTRRGRATAT